MNINYPFSKLLVTMRALRGWNKKLLHKYINNNERLFIFILRKLNEMIIKTSL